MSSNNKATIAIVGAGSIGVAWTLVFASRGYKVSVYDPDPERLDSALEELESICLELIERNLITAPWDEVQGLVTTFSDLERVLEGAIYVQECAPEQLELKRELFAKIARWTTGDTIIASSSSAIPVSLVVENLPCKERALLVHPLNPPYLLRVVEIVPSSWTADAVVDRAKALLESIDMEPLVIGAEIEGFLFNRLQGALLREAYCLVRDGVASVEQIDKAVSNGLGVRWSVLGVFETVDLNTRGGIESHAEKLGPAYTRMGAERGQNDPWTKELVEKVVGERRALLPLNQWEEKVRWRDRRLMDLAEVRKSDKWKQ